MLDLDPTVDLEEDHRGGVPLRLGVDEELHGPGSGVAQVRAEPRRALVKQGPGGLGEVRRRSLLDHLLVPTLHGAVTVADDQDPALTVPEDLHLDVPTLSVELFDVERGVTEPGSSLGGGLGEQPVDVALCVDQVDPAATASVDRLEQHGVTDFVGGQDGSLSVADVRSG